MTTVFLYAPQDFHNLCLLSRTLEVFGHRECHIFDPHQLVRERYGKVRRRELRALSAGAFRSIRWLRVEEPERFLDGHLGHVVATVASPEAVPLAQHRFDAEDLIVFGSESCGLPPEVVGKSSAFISIPVLGATLSLNLAVAFGIVLYERQRQIDAENGKAV